MTRRFISFASPSSLGNILRVELVDVDTGAAIAYTLLSEVELERAKFDVFTYTFARMLDAIGQ